MTENHHYPKAPITEAIIDLRVEVPADCDLRKVEYVHKRVRPFYPDIAEQKQAVANIDLRESVTASASAQTLGFRFTSADKKQIVQSQLTGFTFSRLAPYANWELFRDEARRVWKIYKSTVSPSKISRLAVRYINRIDIAGATINLGTYFRTAPEISDELPQDISTFFLRMELPLPDLPGAAIINEAVVPPPSEGIVSIVLDIDVFRTENVPQGDAEIWNFFEKLRFAKNKVFEACITDASRKLFE